MKLKTLTLSLLLGLAATSAFAEAQYQVRIPANVNLAAPEAPQPPPEPLSLTLSAEALPAGMVGTPYSFNLLDRLTISGGTGSHNYSDTTWSLKAGDALPPGLSLSGSVISGTPTVKNEAGASFELTGMYQDASGRQVYTIVVGGAVLRASKIASGEYFSCAITVSGGVKCWGVNYAGQLGDGTTITKLTPVDVEGLGDRVESIALGAVHACALLETGRVQCWGYNSAGQLGDGSNTSQIHPVYTKEIESNVSSISAGYMHTCAVHNGAAKCWGYNENGRLGNGARTNSNTPVQVSGLTENITRITAGHSFSCASSVSGDAWCWGNNRNGQLGNGTANLESYTPTKVATSNVKSIEAGGSHACALLNDGSVKCWGYNYNGQLGVGGTNQQYSPTAVTNLSGSAIEISAGKAHTCAILNSGSLKCWGYNNDGQIGDNTRVDRTTPVFVQGLNSGVNSVSSGDYHTCTVTNEGEAKCWGNNSAGQIGDGTDSTRTTPVVVLP